tara:strand:+ start:4286 stop:4981 length:696 start_codon:yes stop_codon:yes gene_type:complete
MGKFNSFLDGELLIVDKQSNWTSFDVVNKIRYAIKDKYSLKKIKVGHAGTLDPLATGVLIICTGRKTKTINQYLNQDKEYTGKIKLGATTPSFDLETPIDSHYDVPEINDQVINALIKKFSGELNQVPPNYSAKRIDGKRAYDLARANQELKLRPNKIFIKELSLELSDDKILSFRCKCSKGTYIRALARDIGLALNSGAFLQQLRRIKSGNFSIDQAKTVDQWIEIIKSS